MLEEIAVKVNRVLVSENIVCEFNGKRKLEHFWNSHGRLVSFNEDKNCIKSGHFKLVEIVEDVSYFDQPPVRFTRWDLYLDDELIATDVYEVLKTKIKIIVGWG